jgi:hypothetical protein
MDKVVGSIKNVNYDNESRELEVTIRITDNKFKKKLLRDLSLSGDIKFEGNKLIYLDKTMGVSD